MTPVDGPASARTMRGFKTWRPGYCLECVWSAYKANGARSDGGAYPTALSAWKAVPKSRRHTGDKHPPRGVPVYWGKRDGTDPNASAGDVCISWGDGRVVATDGAGPGRIGIMTIAERGRQIRRPYLGWAEEILGYPIDYPTAPKPTPEPKPEPTPEPTPEPQPQEDDMPKNSGIYTQRASDKKWVYLIFNYGSGLAHEVVAGGSGQFAPAYRNGLTAAFDTTPWTQVSEAHYNVVKQSLQAKLLVDVNDADVKKIASALSPT